MDTFEKRNQRIADLVRAALAEAGWPHAEVEWVEMFRLQITTDEDGPGHPPYALAQKAIDLANEAFGATLQPGRNQEE